MAWVNFSIPPDPGLAKPPEPAGQQSTRGSDHGAGKMVSLAGPRESSVIEEDFSDVHFFAFNIHDNPSLEKQMSFKGVPTISIIKTTESNRLPRIRIMPEPDPPNEKTWYYAKDIKEFIQKEK